MKIYALYFANMCVCNCYQANEPSHLWKGFGVEDDRAMLVHLKALGESMRAINFGSLLKSQVVHRMQGGYSDKMRLEDMMECTDSHRFCTSDSLVIGLQILVHTCALLRVVATSMVDLFSTRPQFWGVMPSNI